MKVSEALVSQISNSSRVRGHSYFTSGAVRSVTVQDGVIHATVRGSATYTVWMKGEGARLRASCTCPYYEDRLDVCKHIWAAILAAEAQSLPLLSPAIAPRDVELAPLYDAEYEGVDLEFEDEDLEEDQDVAAGPVWPRRGDAYGRGAHLARPPLPLPRAPKPLPPPPWRTLLDTVGKAVSPPPSIRTRFAPGQLLYVIDLAASTTSGALVLELMTRDRKLNGEWGKPRPARIAQSDIEWLPGADRHMLERLVGARPYLTWMSYSMYGQEALQMQLQGILASDVLPLLCATNRCVLRLNMPGADPSNPAASPPPPPTRGWSPPVKSPPPALTPIAWDEGPPWRFSAAIHHEGDTDYAIEGWLERADERMALTEPLIIQEAGILITRSHAARVDAGAAFPWLAALRKAGRIGVPAGARDELIDALLAATPPAIDLPGDLHIETVQGQPAPHLRLEPTRYRPDRIRIGVAFEYEGMLIPADSPARIIRAPGSTRAIQRDLEAERRAIDLVRQRGGREEWSQETGTRELQLAAPQMPRVVRQFLDDGWHVEATGRIYRRPGTVALDVKSGIDWFELHGHVGFDDQQASLPALLAALDRGESFVTLGDGTVGLLPEEWLRRHATVARLGSASGDHLRFKTSQAALLDALLAAQPEASWDQAFARIRAELQAFDGIQPVDPPPSFRGALRGYQRDALGWFAFLQRFGFGGCLADDMGLGKTVMVLALLAGRREAQSGDERRPSLVVAPRSVVFNWREEAARFTPALKVLEYVGSARATTRASFLDHDIVLTTYGTLRRDATVLSATRFDYVVLDESQMIKNASTVSAKTTRLLDARHRLALSGTPIENHLGELWSLFEFLNPGLLSTATAFKRAGAGQRLDDDTIAMLGRGLRPFILRRTKEQVAADLPPKTEQTLYCELERQQRALYDELRAHYRRTLLEGTGKGGFGRGKLQVLEALLRLRQAACHPGLLDPKRASEPSAKLDVLLPRVAEALAEGHKTLVFSQFTSLLALVRAKLDAEGIAYEYLDGKTDDRQSRVERFQNDPECRLFLISLKAGGLGLNLTAAEYVFLLDPWWNPAVEAQAIDRAHRIGQERHVFAYRLIARDTVEERVLELQQQKRQLADAILTADSSLIRDLRREDLELLLS
jgi:superfamily II DNA or RNA helicase